MEFIKKLYEQFEEKENELILKQIETQFNHNNENLKKIYLINILISLTNLMDKRLKYLKRKNWELNDFTVKCTKQMMEDNFSDISEESFSEIIQRDFKEKIEENSVNEEENDDKTVWIFQEKNKGQTKENPIEKKGRNK